jgi:hypothetical protein
MTATITSTELAAFTKKLGFESLTDIENEAFIETANSVDSSFDVAGYTDAKVRLIKLYLCAMLSINGVRRESSKSLDVMSKLYNYESLDSTYDWLESAIETADVDGVVSSLIPSSGTGFCFMAVTSGQSED